MGRLAGDRGRVVVLDRGDLEADRLKSPNRRLASGARAADPDFDFAHSMSHRLAGGVLRSLLRGESRALAGALETNPT